MTVCSFNKLEGLCIYVDKEKSVVVCGTEHGRPQAWARGASAPHPWKCCKVFCALAVTVKCSLDQ